MPKKEPEQICREDGNQKHGDCLVPIAFLPVNCDSATFGDMRVNSKGEVEIESSNFLQTILGTVREAVSKTFLSEVLRETGQAVIQIMSYVRVNVSRCALVLCVLVPSGALAHDDDLDAGSAICDGVSDGGDNPLPITVLDGEGNDLLSIERETELLDAASEQGEGPLSIEMCNPRIYYDGENTVIHTFRVSSDCDPYSFPGIPEAELRDFLGHYLRYISTATQETWITTERGSVVLNFSGNPNVPETTDGMLFVLPFNREPVNTQGLSDAEVIEAEKKSIQDSDHFLVKPDNLIKIERTENNGTDTFTVLAIQDGATVVWDTGGDMLHVSNSTWEGFKGSGDTKNVQEVDNGVWRVPENKGAIFGNEGDLILVLNYDDSIWSIGNANIDGVNFDGNSSEDSEPSIQEEASGWSCSVMNMTGVSTSGIVNSYAANNESSRVKGVAKSTALDIPGDLNSVLLGKLKDVVVERLKKLGLLDVDPKIVSRIYLVGAGIAALLGGLMASKNSEKGSEKPVKVPNQDKKAARKRAKKSRRRNRKKK